MIGFWSVGIRYSKRQQQKLGQLATFKLQLTVRKVSLRTLLSTRTPKFRQCPLWVDSVEKVGFSDGLNSGTTTTGEPTRHIEWFFGPSVTFAALLSG